MKLYVIRHGQGLNNVGKALVPNCELTELGQQQAQAIPDFFRDRAVDKIYCSPFTRTIRTAEPLAEGKNRTITLVPELCEHFNGNWPRYGDYSWETSQAIMQQFDSVQFVDRYDPAHNWWPVWPETHEQVDERIRSFYASELRPILDSDASIVVIGHGATTQSLRTLVCPEGIYPDIPGGTNAVIYEYELNSRGECVYYHMHLEHLADCLSPRKNLEG